MSTALQTSDIEELLALMERWGIAEFHLAVEDTALDLVRAVATVEPPALPAVLPIITTASSTPSEEHEAELVVIHAPAVGMFHLAHRGFPEGTPRVGDQVQAGQIIGTLELMHVPNDLVSPVSGAIEALPTEDGAGVEYGQPLLVILPFEEVGEDEAGMLPPPR